MASNLEKYKQDLERLIKSGTELLAAFQKWCKDQYYADESIYGYQMWYSEAHEVIKQILPKRLEEFEKFYKDDNRKIINSRNMDELDYTIQVALLLGQRHLIVVNKFQNQLEILKSAQLRFESSLFEIKQLVQADLFDSELEAARELLKNDFMRAAGAISGVVLEKHLAQVC